MKCVTLIAIFLSLYLCSINTWAVKVYECEDAQGNRTFAQQCAPGTTAVREKRYATGTAKAAADVDKRVPLVLYLVPDCDVCKEVKDFLSVRNISPVEKNVKDNGALQQELKSKTGGKLRVPVLLIGDKAISGYDRTSLTSALTDAGYIAKEPENQ